MKLDPNAPAYPTDEFTQASPGLTIRAELAARAMQALIAAHYPIDVASTYTKAMECADNLIAELNREVGK